jgi:hypothetical protein
MTQIIKLAIVVILGYTFGCFLAVAKAAEKAASEDKIVRVAVVDTGYDKDVSRYPFFDFCKTGHYSFMGRDKDKPEVVGYGNHPHGTMVVNMIAETAGLAKYCIVMITIPEDGNLLIEAIHKARLSKSHIINLSWSGLVRCKY